MKYALATFLGLALTGSAAADPLSEYATMRPGYDWTGSYIGGQIGHGWGGSPNSWHGGGFPPWQPDGDINYQSMTAGIHAGHMQQSGTIVGGIEADLSGAKFFGDDAQFAGVINQIEINALASLRGRLGFASDNLLFYGTAGFAAASFLKNEAGGQPTAPQLAFGWTAGAGVELAVTDALRVRAEYLHTRLGEVHTYLNYMHRADAPVINVVRVGASYLF